VVVAPVRTNFHGDATFFLEPGRYQVEVARTQQYEGAIQVVQFKDCSNTISICLRDSGIVDPPGVFETVPLNK
jgi:hypothetical protein